MDKLKKITEIVSLTEKDKTIVELLDKCIQSLYEKLEQIEEVEFRTGIMNEEEKNSLKTAISYIQEVRLSVFHDYTNKMSEQEFNNILNLVCDSTLAKAEAKQKEYEKSLGEANDKRIEKLLELCRTVSRSDSSYNEKEEEIEKEFNETKREIDFKYRKRDSYKGPKYNNRLKGNQSNSQKEILEDRLFLEYIKYIRKNPNNLEHIRTSINNLEEYLKVKSKMTSVANLETEISLCSFVNYICSIYGVGSQKETNENLEIVTQIRQVIEYFESIVLESTEYMYMLDGDINTLINLYNQISNVESKSLKI